MSAIEVAIVGMGPRGMTVLERLVSICRRFDCLSLVVHVIEPGEMGCGVHGLDQPSYLLLNTVCGLPTMFPPRRYITDIEGESFCAWVRRQPYVPPNPTCRNNVVDGINLPLQSSYLPRAVFGAYLRACYERILRQRPTNMEVVVHACDAVALRRKAGRECIECSDGTQVSSQFVVLTPGHTPNMRLPGAAIDDSQRFLASLGQIDLNLDANTGIGIAGFGLSAFDVVAALTVGRGGTFCNGLDGRLRYERSGREPRVHMFSRSGLPYLAQPDRDCGTFRYVPVLFEASRIRAIRSAQGRRGLNFESTLLPLLSVELRAAYCRKTLEMAGRPISDDDWAGLRASDAMQIERWVDETERSMGRFDVAGFLAAPDLSLGSSVEYQQSFVDLLEQDLRECRLGLEASVTKHIASVVLHLRDSFNAAVDFGGLDARSHDYFFERFAGTVRRLAIGPQRERSEELIALIDAGVVHVGLGPNPTVEHRVDGSFKLASRNLVRSSSCVVSRVIQAQSPFPSVERSDSPLLASLKRSGRVRKHRSDVRFDAGIEIDRVHHPIGYRGQVEDSLFVLGPWCEGSIYYNTYVPTVVGWSRPFVEAELVVDEIMRIAGLTARPAKLNRSGREG